VIIEGQECSRMKKVEQWSFTIGRSQMMHWRTFSFCYWHSCLRKCDALFLASVSAFYLAAVCTVFEERLVSELVLLHLSHLIFICTLVHV